MVKPGRPVCLLHGGSVGHYARSLHAPNPALKDVEFAYRAQSRERSVSLYRFRTTPRKRASTLARVERTADTDCIPVLPARVTRHTPSTAAASCKVSANASTGGASTTTTSYS